MAEPLPADMPAPSILPMAAEGLSFSAGDVVILRDVSFRVEAGTRNIVLGPNGAGKSVLMRLLHGLLNPVRGSVNWTAADTVHARRAQAMVFQKPVMLRRSVQQNIEFALSLAGHPDVSGEAGAALDRVGLCAIADRPARLCSGGEQQRIALARAWALRPQVLFLDEPTSSLDPAATRAIEEIIAAMHARGTTVVMTTHDIGQAKRLADRVLFLHQGQLIEDSPASIFFKQARTPEAAAFIKGELLW